MAAGESGAGGLGVVLVRGGGLGARMALMRAMDCWKSCCISPSMSWALAMASRTLAKGWLGE